MEANKNKKVRRADIGKEFVLYCLNCQKEFKFDNLSKHLCPECNGELFSEKEIKLRYQEEKKRQMLELKKEREQEFNKSKHVYKIEAKLADDLYKAYITDGLSRLEKINGRFLASQTIKLDKLIEQNDKIIGLLEQLIKIINK